MRFIGVSPKRKAHDFAVMQEDYALARGVPPTLVIALSSASGNLFADRRNEIVISDRANMTWRCAAMCLVVLGSSASASTSQSGHVSNMIVNRSGRFFFDHDGSRDASPSCAVYSHWVIDASVPYGQAMMSLVMTVPSRGNPIVVYGDGECKDRAGTESIHHVQVIN